MTFISAQLRNSYFCSMLLIGVAHADPNGFAFSTINPTGSTATTAGGVNNIGQIVGGETLTGGTQNGFLSSGGTFTTFDASQGSMAGSYAEGINNNGQIVGLSLASGTGFLLSGGTFTAVAVPGSDNGTTNAIGINDSGQIVGTFQKGGVPYGFLLSGGSYTTITAPGSTATVASGINNSGQIVGWFTSSGVTSGFLLNGATYTTLTYPGSSSTKAFGINNSGQIVGEYTIGGITYGLLLQGAHLGAIYATLSAPGSTSTSATGINDAGQIVGRYTSGGATLGFSAAQNSVAISIFENPLNPPGYNATGLGAITVGPDSALWYTATTLINGGTLPAFVLGRMSTVGSATAEYTISGFPTVTFGDYGIATGSDGALWSPANEGSQPCGHASFCNQYYIARTTTAGAITSFGSTQLEESFSASPPAGIVPGPDGALWFTVPGDNSLASITTSGIITMYPLPTPNANPIAIAAGPDGALWFTESGDNSIGRITAAGQVTEYPLPTPSASPIAITSGPDSALWFTELGDNSIGRITTAGLITEYAVPSANAFGSNVSFVAGITIGPDGALWFTESNASNLARITTSGAITEYPLPAGNTNPAGIVAGPDGSLWFAQWHSGNVGHAIVLNSTPSALSISGTHTGNFTQGQTGATYSVTVSNLSSTVPTSGAITVTDILPSGLTQVSMAGSGWTCSGNSCTRNDSLAAGQSYPALTVTLNVASNAGSPLVNQVSVWGGGSEDASATDMTIVQAAPVVPILTITKTHTGNFTQGQSGATYAVTVSNSGVAATSGTVTVTDTLPSGMTLVSMAGVGSCTATNCGGWTCVLDACTRSDSLAVGARYPAITVTVNVAANATSPQVNSVSASGGGSASASATDSTIIGPPPHPPFFNGEQNLGSGVYYLTFPNGTLFGTYTYLQGSFLYHYDLGFEYIIPANDVTNDAYFYDFTSGHWWFTGPGLFQNIYDFTLGAWIYYINDPANPGHYTTNPRKFAYDTTHVTFTM